LLVGTPPSPLTASIIARLLDGDVLPAVLVEPGASVGDVLAAAANALGARYPDARFDVTIATIAEIESASLSYYDDDDEPTSERDGGRLCATFTNALGCIHIDARAFASDLRGVDRRFAASLIEHIRRATFFSAYAFTPADAFNVVEMRVGTADEFWHGACYNAAQELGIDVGDVTGTQVRAYVQNSEEATPGFYRRSIGRAHHDIGLHLATLDQLEVLAEAAHANLRPRVANAIAALRELYTICELLERQFTNDARGIVNRMSRMTPLPGIVVETSNNGIVGELVNDLWEEAANEGDGMGPAYALVINDDVESIAAFRHTLEAFQRVSQLVRVLATAIDPIQNPPEGEHL
jgi:hypothetical protein